MPLQKAIAQRLGTRQDDEQQTSPEAPQEPSAPEPSSMEDAVDSVVPPEEAVATEAASDIVAEPLEGRTDETGGGEGELQQATPADAVETQTGEAAPALGDSLMDVFRTEDGVADEERLPAGLVEIDIYELLEDCEAILQRLKGGVAVS